MGRCKRNARPAVPHHPRSALELSQPVRAGVAVSERPYKGIVLARAFATRLTDEDYEILYSHGPGVRTFYGRADRADAERIFADVADRSDNAPKKEILSNRSD